MSQIICPECGREQSTQNHHFCPKHPEDNAFSYGQKLKVLEKESSKWRISRALLGDTGVKMSEQTFIASKLYDAKYDNHDYSKETEEWPGAGEILDIFCLEVFGATFDEVMRAWDKFLG